MYSDLQYIHVMATSREMTSGRPFPLILNFAFPLLLGNLLQQTYSLMDAAIVGKFLGINALASVGASTSVVFLILGFCNGCCGGFGIPVAQKFGARDYGMMRRFVAVSLQLAAVMSVVIAIVTSMFCSDILQMMQTPENILEDAYLYLLITFIGVPCTFFYNLLSSIIRALGDSKTPFWFLLFTTILNILLDLFCILILDWGVAGAAVATVFSQGVSAVLCYLYMMRHFEILKGTPTEHKFRGALAKTLLYIGVPMGLQFSITAIGSIMLQSANNALGTACVAAFTAAMRIKMFCMCPLESLGIAMATYSGQNYGAGKPKRIWLGIKDAAERDNRILAVHFHYLAHRGLSLYSDVAAGDDCREAFRFFPRLLFCQSLGRRSVLFSIACFLFLFPVLLFFQLFHLAGNFFFQFLVGKRFH